MLRDRIWMLLLFACLFAVSTELGEAQCDRPPCESADVITTSHPDYILVEGDLLLPRDAATRGGFVWRRWPQRPNTIPWDFEVGVPAQGLIEIAAAMNIWEASANVDFVQCAFETCPGTASYVHFRNSDDGNYVIGGVGMKAGKNEVAIQDWTQRTIMHELGHILGLYHEQSRPDRDDYLTIQFTNIDPDKWDQFNPPASSQVWGPYDFVSVMHYGQCAFAIDCAAGVSILVNLAWRATWQNQIGMSSTPSPLDQRLIAFLYPPPDHWYHLNPAATHSSTPTGAFTLEYKSWPNAIAGIATNITPIPTLWITPGTYIAAGSYSKPMIWRNAYPDDPTFSDRIPLPVVLK